MGWAHKQNKLRKATGKIALAMERARKETNKLEDGGMNVRKATWQNALEAME